MAIQTGVNVTKAVGYAVLSAPTGVSVTKAVCYVVLEPPNAQSPTWGVIDPPDGIVAIPYSYTWDMPTAASPVTYTVQSGTLPDGLSLSAVGDTGAKLDGTPTTADTYTFTLRASNSAGIADKEFSVTIAEPDAVFPAESDVRTAITYGPTGADYTGTCAVPSPNDVRSGTAVDATTGNLTLPIVGNVRTGIQYGTSGTQYTGTLTLPATTSVLTTASYGAGGTEYTGTVTLPAVSDVRDGVTFGASLGSTGTVVLPVESDVRSTVQYGAGGTEFTGTLSGGGGEHSFTWG